MSGRDVVTRKYSLTVNPADPGRTPAASGGTVPLTYVPSTDTRTTEGREPAPSRETSSGGMVPLTHVLSTDTCTTEGRTPSTETAAPTRETSTGASNPTTTPTPPRDAATSSGSGSSAPVVTYSPPRDALSRATSSGSGTTGSSGGGSAVVTVSPAAHGLGPGGRRDLWDDNTTPPRTAPVMSMSITTERLPTPASASRTSPRSRRKRPAARS